MIKNSKQPPETTEPADAGTWGHWSEWSSCGATCGVGEKTRSRECSEGKCFGSPTESMKCVNYNSNSCGTAREIWPQGNRITVFEGEYCNFPSFGNGWFDEEIEGTRVQLGVECSTGEVYDNGDHVIASRGANCNFVCQTLDGDRTSYRKEFYSDANFDPEYRKFQEYLHTKLV